MNMPKRLKSLFLFVSFLFLLYACSTWQKTIQYGSLQNETFEELVDIEVFNGLIIMPVVINGKTYRFLFDSGAPLSISHQLQDQFQYKTVSKGHMVDSDKNRQKINYVRMDTIFIGDIPFVDQTALVINFDGNPFIACLGLDGIIGSNLMRFCNWQINYQDSLISFSNSSINEIPDNAFTIPFTTDNQYDIQLDLHFGESTISTMKVDYGSNGSISIPKSDFKELYEKGAFGNIYNETGTAQSGIVGNPINIKRQVTIVDTIKAGESVWDNVRVRTGKSKLIGQEILSRYVVTIDWEHKQLYLAAVDSVDKSHKSFGFGTGYSDDKKIIIRSVIENSTAWKNGMKPNMEILKIDSLDFTTTHTFCDYVNFTKGDPHTIDILLKDDNGNLNQLVLEKELLVK